MEEERRRQGQFVYSSYILMVIDHNSGCVMLSFWRLTSLN